MFFRNSCWDAFRNPSWYSPRNCCCDVFRYFSPKHNFRFFLGIASKIPSACWYFSWKYCWDSSSNPFYDSCVYFSRVSSSDFTLRFLLCFLTEILGFYVGTLQEFQDLFFQKPQLRFTEQFHLKFLWEISRFHQGFSHSLLNELLKVLL